MGSIKSSDRYRKKKKVRNRLEALNNKDLQILEPSGSYTVNRNKKTALLKESRCQVVVL